MKRKIHICSFVMVMLLSLSTVSFAENRDNNNMKHNNLDSRAMAIEKAIDLEEVNTNVVETREDFKIEKRGLKIFAPKADDGVIKMKTKESTINLKLPEDRSANKASLTKNGMILYPYQKSNFDVALIAGEEKTSGMEIFRVMVNIHNPKAPKNYMFNYDLPDGYKIISYESYLKNQRNRNYNEQAGALVIVDQLGEPVMLIHTPWAKDANGKTIPTHYTVKGNKVIQTVNFDTENKFPVIADPGHSTPIKYTKYLTHKRIIAPGFYPNGQGKGVILRKGDSMSYSPAGGGDISVALSVGGNYGPVSFGISIGYTAQGVGMSYSAQAKKKGRYKLKVWKAVEYDIYSKMMKWKEGGKTRTVEYGRTTKHESESVEEIRLILQ